jgi:thiamine biosynthesis lipoprotein
MREHRVAFRAMGSPCELRLYAGDPETARRVAAAAVAEVARLERKYSRYRGDSLAARINRSAGDAAGLEVDPETAGLLDYAERAWQQSDGLFDVTSGVLRRAWDFKSGRVPSQCELDAVLPCVGWDKLRWARPRLALPLPGMEIDFGGYVKEYAVDRVAALCRAGGIASGLVDLGGDLAALGPHPDGRPWTVGIRHPREPHRAIAKVDVARGGIASSGDYERCMLVDGVRYGHILDPRTGWPARGLAAVSVLAPHCLVAGTASTIGMLMGAREAAAWLDALGLPHLRVDADGALGGSLAGSGPDQAASRSGSGTTTSSGCQPRARRRSAAEPASERLPNPVA